MSRGEDGTTAVSPCSCSKRKAKSPDLVFVNNSKQMEAPDRRAIFLDDQILSLVSRLINVINQSYMGRSSHAPPPFQISTPLRP
jgi:hypothetical protein